MLFIDKHISNSVEMSVYSSLLSLLCVCEGDYGSAIETLVTAISLIKQSKIAQDDRCKILISSLQDTLHGIESKSYSSKLAFDDLFCCTSNRYMVTMFIILCQVNKLVGDCLQNVFIVSWQSRVTSFAITSREVTAQSQPPFTQPAGA